MVQTLHRHRTPVQVNVICVTSLMKAADRSPYSRWGKFCFQLKKAFLLPHGSLKAGRASAAPLMTLPALVEMTKSDWDEEFFEVRPRMCMM